MKSALALVFVSSVALAQRDAGFTCEDAAQQLSFMQRTLSACNARTQSLQTARDTCRAELEDSKQKLSSTGAEVEACVARRDQVCSEAAALAASILEGTAREVEGCVPPETQRRVQQLLNSWNTLGRAVAQIDEYASGSSDSLPRLLGQSLPEKHLFRAIGGRSGVPLWNRRILIAAFNYTAPRAWARIRSQGTLVIDSFFAAHGPLPQEFVAEVRGEHVAPDSPAGPPLTAALRLVLSYLEVSGCRGVSGPPECGRARQLLALLDETGPLIVRRRIEAMYGTPCDELDSDTVRGWLQDFPASGSKEKSEALAELTAAARSKLFTCYLRDEHGEAEYRKWVDSRLPKQAELDARALPLVDELQRGHTDTAALDRCGRAVRAMQQIDSRGCQVPADKLATLAAWAGQPRPSEGSADLSICQRVAAQLWNGASLRVPQSPAGQLRVNAGSETGVTLLRRACDERQGSGAQFERDLDALSRLGEQVGESLASPPWRVEPQRRVPLERARYDALQGYGTWVRYALKQESACEALGLNPPRCEACRAGTSAYDCELTASLTTTWRGHRKLTIVSALGLLLAGIAWSYVGRVRRARRLFAGPLQSIRESFEGLGIHAEPDSLAWLFPQRGDLLRLTFPNTPSWERWGQRGIAVLAPSTFGVREADVNHAGALALRENVRIAFILHPEASAPDLGAVRATLDWAARGGSRAVQIMPIALSRLAWATRDEDLLDLVESTSLRGNPFEVRGPVRSSSQFWNRERLVAGLLSEARAGHWVVITGLRRFGKSSLALEVARRIGGPSAYVDLAGFHHEVRNGESAGIAVEAILRTLVVRLAESAHSLYPAAALPPIPGGALDAPTLAGWLRSLSLACATASGTRAPPMLLVLDEVEQLLSAPPEKLNRALEVMATLTGRLRSAFAEPTSPHAGSSVSVVLCAALHPLLWAPLDTLGGQSLMGAFPSICVPALDDEAAHAMMRGLGARQGIRFEDDALSALVKASHGVPLLLRRLGTSVLELYDADRARQGALGAVRIGVEGATEAIRREERGGSPLRVWVESEIAQAETSAGVLLRALVNEPRVSVVSLSKLVENQVMERFIATGLTAHLVPAELKRRAQEAASVTVRLLAESRLLETHGDLTSPEAYSLPDGVIRRILREGQK